MPIKELVYAADKLKIKRHLPYRVTVTEV